MLPDDTLEALLRLPRKVKRLAGYRPRRRTWCDIDAALTAARERGYVVIPEVPKDAQVLVDEAWWEWCMWYGQPAVILFPQGRRSTLRLTLPRYRVLPDAQVVELTAMAKAACAHRNTWAHASSTDLIVKLWTREAEAFAAMLRDYVLEHMVPAPQPTPSVLTGNRCQ
jgi:hypothetical protein